MQFSLPFTSYKKNGNGSTDLRVDTPQQMANGMHGYNSTTTNGAPNSPAPFIKNEPQDDNSRFSNHQQFSHHPEAYSMSANSGFNHNGGFDNSDFQPSGSVDPQNLSIQTGGFFPSYGNSVQNMSAFIGGGNSGNAIDDDDLRASLAPDQDFLLDNSPHHDPYGSNNSHANGVTRNADVYSHTPDQIPAGSPYARAPYPYGRLYDDAAGTPSSYNASPIIGSGSTQSTHFDAAMANGKRKTRLGYDVDRSPSVMSPHTPKTPAITALSIDPQSASLPGQPIHMRHHKSFSGQWDGTPQSYDLHSPLHSPIPTQIQPNMHFGGKSLPSKVEHVQGTNYQSQEAKRRRRRESHNMVERRRRDNINERIQELSSLVPQHRLEDEKVRKHLLNSGSLSPTAGTSGSPPRFAATTARRASVINTEEKDKGPNKGDILNGAVGWTKDLMWAMYRKLEQEEETKKLVESLGGTWPFEQTEEEKRMAAEIRAAVRKNGVGNFAYSRAPGSGLRVPMFTDLAGGALKEGEQGGRVQTSTPPGGFWEGVVKDEEGMDMS
ncbi:hypothetical protein FPQ18DRAFT_55717 [Pyronema domesticum]|uniref:BHLH domain-containing protein n=1 Tax=Pyronema omphalodes (strain CBS 100304) TaxID=1076935 RepID=U4LS12_PYROM|nr:hypothetical protein FPQ18DRAFT_55717 [Pyronema domesticum]CCX30086.1 Similar to hypothetical protein [Tuber melanosporum Mel28]; acc. no. XP_002836960 [Pyronema omphalodes CBS 100304]